MKCAAILALIGIGSALGQQPNVQNAQTETRAVTGGLEATFRAIVNGQSAAAWIGYAVPILAGDRQMCCWSDNVRGCFLEPRTGSDRTIVVSANQTIKLEGPTHLLVLYRVENRDVGRIRSFSPECQLDAGGLPFYWLTGVNSAESVKMLQGMVRDSSVGTREQNHRGDAAISAIAMHADPAAETVLEELVAPSQAEQVRRQAVFGLAQRRDPQALKVVLNVAHNDKSPKVRGQALFWLAQRAGQKIAESAINDAIANDPETEVKKKAVFALTQMPSGEGIPLLIQVARTNRNPEVRKQAMFWLGQSKDDRALTFIEEVLGK